MSACTRHALHGCRDSICRIEANRRRADEATPVASYDWTDPTSPMYQAAFSSADAATDRSEPAGCAPEPARFEPPADTSTSYTDSGSPSGCD